MSSPSSTPSIEARPMPFTIDPSRTAVIVVDMQNDFASEGGAFAPAGLDIGPVQSTIAVRLATATRRLLM
jgi:ureidoacrylate peracid hydrolase